MATQNFDADIPEVDNTVTSTPLTFGQVQYSNEERYFLQESLNDKLGDNYVISRPGPGGKPVHYIATATAISLANQTFGFNGWSSEISSVSLDYIDQLQTGRFRAGISAVVRVTLKDGTFHEDIGYGHVDNIPDKGQAIENARKKAVSDALKRALRHFGNALGLTVYDKDHITALAKSKSRAKILNGGGSEVGHNTRPQNPHFKARSSLDLTSQPSTNETTNQSSNGASSSINSQYNGHMNPPKSPQATSNIQQNGTSNGVGNQDSKFTQPSVIQNNGLPPQRPPTNSLTSKNSNQITLPPQNNSALGTVPPKGSNPSAPPRNNPLPPQNNNSLPPQNGSNLSTLPPQGNNNSNLNLPPQSNGTMNSHPPQVNNNMNIVPPQNNSKAIPPQNGNSLPPQKSNSLPQQTTFNPQNNKSPPPQTPFNGPNQILGKRSSPPQQFFPNKMPRM